MKKIYILTCVFFLFTAQLSFAQDELEKLLNETTQPEDKKVMATFKTTKVISAQSTETVKQGTLDFRITHRFSNIGGSAGGVHTLYGFDNSDDIRFSFDYGLLDNLQIGVGRSKRNENIDGSFKWRFLEQTTDNKAPLTIAWYELASFSPVNEDQFYLGVDTSVTKKTTHRLAYTSQFILARKFHWRFSLELIPSYTHRNFVKAYVNSNNNAEEENAFFSLGAAMRFKFTKRFGILVDYFHPFSKFRENNPAIPYYDPMAVGFEIETGGHVFHITFTNAAGIIDNEFLPNTSDNWLEGGFKFGFNISRVFTVKRVTE
jgi:hypothetical protein